MRSELVFSAMNRIKNRYLLCHIVRLRARGPNMKQGDLITSINDVLAGCVEKDVVHGKTVIAVKPVEAIVFTGEV